MWWFAFALAGPYDKPALTVPVESNAFVWSGQNTTVGPSGGDVQLGLSVPEGGRIYRDKIVVKERIDGPLTVHEVSLPVGVLRKDPAGETTRMLYTDDLELSVRVTGPPGIHKLQLEVEHQGCIGRLCYPPTTQNLNLTVRVTK